MLRNVVSWLWHRDPTRLIAVGLAMAFLCDPGLAVLGLMVFVSIAAYVQNWSYSLQSRSAMRDSIAYHLLASLLSSFAFFVTFRAIVLKQMPWDLFPAYLFGTVLGSVHGQSISRVIERRLKLSAKADVIERKLGITQIDGKPWEGEEARLFRFWPAVIVLLVAFVAQVAWMQRLNPDLIWLVALLGGVAYLSLRIMHDALYDGTVNVGRIVLFVATLAGAAYVGYGTFLTSYEATLFVAFMAVEVLDKFLHSVHRVARSSDNYWFHLAVILLKASADLFRIAVLLKTDVTWALLLPMATGSMLGTLSGATYAKRFAERINVSYDAHITEGRKVSWPLRQYGFLGICIATHLMAFGLYEWQGMAILTGYAFLQYAGFTLSSRARQRKDPRYMAWSSVVSNGVFYLCMKQLAHADAGAGEQQEVVWAETAPYVVGNSAGSLAGQTVAMRVEQVLGAVMDEDLSPPKDKGDVVPFPSKEKAS